MRFLKSQPKGLLSAAMTAAGLTLLAGPVGATGYIHEYPSPTLQVEDEEGPAQKRGSVEIQGTDGARDRTLRGAPEPVRARSTGEIERRELPQENLPPSDARGTEAAGGEPETAMDTRDGRGRRGKESTAARSTGEVDWTELPTDNLPSGYTGSARG